MRYYRRLAYRLRRRHLPESEVARALGEVRDLSTASAQAPQEEFGPAEDYAASFREGGARRTWTRAITWAAWGAGFGFVVLNVELRRRGSEPLLPWWAVLGTWLGAAAVGQGARFVLDHRLPRSFRAAAVPELVAPRPGRPGKAAPAARARGPEGDTGAAKPLAYYRSLAFHLRLRHLPEVEVARVLEDVRELSQASGATPAEDFGPADVYAEQFERRRRRYDLGLVVFLGCVLSGAAIGLTNLVAGLRGGERLLSPGTTLLVLAVLLVGGATFAVLYEHRLPRGFRDAWSAGADPGRR